MSRKTTTCAAVDLGATSGRVIVGTWKSGRLELEEVHRFPNQFKSLGGHDYWDLPGLWENVRAGLAQAVSRFPRLASVGVDTWGVDYVLLGKDGRLVYPAHSYRDNRTQAISAAFKVRDLKRIYELTGIPNVPFNTSLQLHETLRSSPGIETLARRCLFLPDYFNYLLTGVAENEISISSHSQMLALARDDWSREAQEYFGVPSHWFSKPALAPKVLGKVKGLPGLERVKGVLVPGHDTACAFTAMPASPDGTDLYLSSGTWSLIGFEAEIPIVGPRALEARVSNERMGDGRFRPLCSGLGLWLLERLLPEFSVTLKTSEQWNNLITAVEGSVSLGWTLDLNDVALFNPVSMRQAIDAQVRRRRKPPIREFVAYVRLIFESIAAHQAAKARLLAELRGRAFSRILIVGGGSNNRFLCQATANASGLPVVSYQLEGSAVGNIASQLIALGALPSLKAFREGFARQLHPTVYSPQS